MGVRTLSKMLFEQYHVLLMVVIQSWKFVIFFAVCWPDILLYFLCARNSIKSPDYQFCLQS